MSDPRKRQLPSSDDPELGGRLEKLLQHVHDLGLGDAALATSYEVIGEILGERARMAHDRAEHAGIAEEVIEAPIFVTGLPRSGTTLLHMLIGADPNNRMPKLWEVARPSPPPGLGREIEARRGRTDQELKDLLRVDPTLLQAHPYFDEGGEAAAECEHLGVLDFHFVRRTLGYYSRIPAFLNVELIESDVAFFRSHKQILQHLQWRTAPKRWTLKGTEHYIRLHALKTVYPDARIVWIHRDPQKVFPSIMALHCNLAEGMSGQPVDRVAFGRQLLNRYGAMLETAMQSEFLRHPDVVHLLYADFAADPVAAIASCYAQLRLPFDAETEASIRGWLTSNRGDRHGRFKYDLGSFGIDRDELEARFAGYRAAFDIPFEGSRVASAAAQ